ncbi:MAG: hypothetical protein P8P36_11375, partial [Akkermansiaceae bacterium]|nr:hypothetical protein [Akkermansiaceae bacterium]
MKTVFYIPACIYSLTLLALTLSPVHAFVGEKESVFINWLKKHIGHSEQVSNYDDGVYKLITTWQIDLKNDIRDEPHILGLNPLSKLGHGVWEIQISSFYRYNKQEKIGPDGRKDKGNQI